MVITYSIDFAQDLTHLLVAESSPFQLKTRSGQRPRSLGRSVSCAHVDPRPLVCVCRRVVRRTRVRHAPAPSHMPRANRVRTRFNITSPRPTKRNHLGTRASTIVAIQPGTTCVPCRLDVSHFGRFGGWAQINARSRACPLACERASGLIMYKLCYNNYYSLRSVQNVPPSAVRPPGVPWRSLDMDAHTLAWRAPDERRDEAVGRRVECSFRLEGCEERGTMCDVNWWFIVCVCVCLQAPAPVRVTCSVALDARLMIACTTQSTCPLVLFLVPLFALKSTWFKQLRFNVARLSVL